MTIPLKRDPGEPIAIPGMAYFANTGPLGTHCEQCAFFLKAGGKSPKTAPLGRCRKYLELTGCKEKAAPKFERWRAACKYWQDSKASTVTAARELSNERVMD